MTRNDLRGRKKFLKPLIKHLMNSASDVPILRKGVNHGPWMAPFVHLSILPHFYIFNGPSSKSVHITKSSREDSIQKDNIQNDPK